MKRILMLVVLSALFVMLTVSCSKSETSLKEQEKVQGMAFSDTDSNKGTDSSYPSAEGIANDSNDKVSEEVAEKSIKVYYYNPVDDYICYEKVKFNRKENSETYFFEKYFKFVPKDNFVTNMPGSTKINSINFYADKDLVVMDVSENFTQLMNIGGGVESSIIQYIANTLCEAYGGKRLIITTKGEDYQGSHIEISPMNSIAMNTKGIKEINK